MKNQLIEVFNKHDYDYSDIDFTKESDNIVQQIEEDLIHKLYDIAVARKIMSEVWKLQKNTKLVFLKHNIMKGILDDISSHDGYKIQSNFVVCNKFIPCTAIKTLKVFYILDETQIQKLIGMGFGIKSYKVEISKTIGDIYCTGKHPNLSVTSKSFCIDYKIHNMNLTFNNLLLAEEMLSQFNLTSNFLEEREYSKIMEVVECRNKK